MPPYPPPTGGIGVLLDIPFGPPPPAARGCLTYIRLKTEMKKYMYTGENIFFLRVGEN